MPDIFSFKESYELLGTNPKTFKNWLIKAGIDPSKQINLADPRKKYVTKEQLRLLAQQHGRNLPPLTDDGEPKASMTVEMLAEQLATFQQQATQRFTQIDQSLLQMISLLQEIGLRQHAAQQADLPSLTHESE